MKMEHTKLRRVARISGGIFGEENAISKLRTNCFWLPSFNCDQQLTNPAANNSLPTKGCKNHGTDYKLWESMQECILLFHTCSCASLAQVLNAGEGDSLRSSMLKCRIHSAQSSLVLRCEASPAVRKRPSLTCTISCIRRKLEKEMSTARKNKNQADRYRDKDKE